MKKLQRHGERFKGLTLGLDLHKKMIQYSVLDEAGDETANDRMAAKAAELSALTDRLTVGGQALQVVVEASGCFVWAYDLLAEKIGRANVHVAAPSRVRAIAESSQKTDETDAWWLAYLLYERRLPEAFVAEGDLRELRIAGRELRSVTDERSDLMRRLKSHLAQLGLSFRSSDWSSMVGRKRIEALVKEVRQRHGLRGQAIWRLWKRIRRLSVERTYWQQQVEQLGEKFDEVTLLDQQLPGTGPVIAAIIWSELGDPQRYRSAKAYAKATGLTPGYRRSAGKTSKKKITREGSALVRWALTRAVVSTLRTSKPGAGLWIKRWVGHQAKRKPKKWAIVCAARKLAEGVWRLFAWGEAFDLSRAFGYRPLPPQANPPQARAGDACEAPNAAA